MKRWLDRILRREDWIAQAVRHGLDAFGREPIRREPAPRPEPSEPRARETRVPQVEVSSSIP